MLIQRPEQASMPHLEVVSVLFMVCTVFQSLLKSSTASCHSQTTSCAASQSRICNNAEKCMRLCRWHLQAGQALIALQQVT